MSMLKNIGIILVFLLSIYFMKYIPLNLGGALLIILPFLKGISIKENSNSKQKMLAVINFFIFFLSILFITMIIRPNLGSEDIGAIFLFLYVFYDAGAFVVAMVIRNQQPKK